MKHHRAGGIHNLYPILPCTLIGLWRFTVGTQQHLGMLQPIERGMVDGHQPHALEPVTFPAVVNNVAQTIERRTARQFLLCLSYGTGHSKTEARTLINLYSHRQLSYTVPSARPSARGWS